MKDNKLKQRALILQGGGSLGAYEVGVVHVLYHWIKKDCNENDNIFDIIAGTSIGAINAAIMTSHAIERRKKDSTLTIKDSWNGVTERLLSFWKEISSLTIADAIPFYEEIWNASRYMAENFQNNLSYWSNLFANSNPFLSESINQWIHFLKTNYELPAKGEAARRFYSAKQFLFTGAKNVFIPYMPKLDTKFYYNIPFLPNNIWYNYNNSWLENTLTKYVTFPIATSFYSENYNDSVANNINNEHNNRANKSNINNIIKEPRLLIVSVDIQGGKTISFDSYEYSAKRKCPICPISDEDMLEEDNMPQGVELIQHIKETHFDFIKIDGIKKLRFTAYDNPNNISSGDHNDQEKYILFYNEGINSEHVMASASIPIFYNYRKLVANKYNLKGEFIGNQERYFWDGILLSNTPLRELISSHTVYWRDKIGKNSLLDEILKVPTNTKDDIDNVTKSNNKKIDPIELSRVPDLEVYIANIWTSKEEEIPTDHDLLKDRENDIRNHDKTIYDEKASELVTDYINLCKELITNFAKENNSTIKNILEYEVTSKLRNGKRRKNKDLLLGKFAINNVIRIEKKDDPYSISEKWLDLSKTTIDKLIKEGIKDTVCTLIMEIVKSLDNKDTGNITKEELFKILNDVENYDIDKRNIIFQKFLTALENNGYDKISEKKNNIIKSVDALIESLYHAKYINL